MNENLQEAIGLLITKTLEGVDKSVDFLSAELPDYVYQLLLWYGVYSFIVFIASLVFPVIVGWGIFRVNKKAFAGDDAEELAPAAIILSGLVAAPTIGFAASNINLTWLQIWIAPKVWLVEYAASLTK